MARLDNHLANQLFKLKETYSCISCTPDLTEALNWRRKKFLLLGPVVFHWCYSKSLIAQNEVLMTLFAKFLAKEMRRDTTVICSYMRRGKIIKQMPAWLSTTRVSLDIKASIFPWYLPRRSPWFDLYSLHSGVRRHSE